MFPSTTTRRPNKRSLGELVRGAVDTALEFATLGEAPSAARAFEPSQPAPTSVHPHRRPLGRTKRVRRPGTVRARAQVCTSPVIHHPAKH